jgi:hypothetical protein
MGDNALRCLEAAWDRFDLCAAPFGNDRSLREGDAAGADVKQTAALCASVGRDGCRSGTARKGKVAQPRSFVACPRHEP